MDSDELIEILEKEKLLHIVKKNSVPLKKVLKRCLKVKKEEVLLLGDKGFFNRKLSPLLTASYCMAADKLGLDTNVVMQDPKNKSDSAEQKIMRSLIEHPENNVVIMNMSGSLGRVTAVTKSFRATMRLNSHKFTSMSSLGALDNSWYPVVLNAIDVNYRKMQKTGAVLKGLLDNAKTAHVTNDAGTDLKFDIHEHEAISNDGKYDAPGKGGNMPAGEVYIPPVNGTANGTIVIDGSVRHHKGTTLIKDPVILKVKDGRIKSISNNIEGNMLRESIEWAEKTAKNKENVWKIAELGIGINPNCKIVGQTTIDEKAIGTCHFANGSNAWFGGDIRSNIHLDHVLRDVTIKLDNEEIMSDGVHKF